MANTPTLDFIPIGIESTSNINNPINILKNQVGDPTIGLPEDLFQFMICPVKPCPSGHGYKGLKM